MFEPPVAFYTFEHQVQTAHLAPVVYEGQTVVKLVQTVWTRVLFVQSEFHK